MAALTNENLTTLNTAFNAIFNEALASAKPTYTQVATVVKSSTASNTYGWLGEMPDVVEWTGKRKINDFKTHGYAITNKLFESTIGVKRTDIEDDNVGIYRPLFTALGQRAALHPEKLVYGLLKKGEENNGYDGVPFFGNHTVYQNSDGTGSTHTVSNLIEGDQPAWYLLDTSQALKPFIFQERQAPELTALNKTDDEGVFMEDQYRYGVRSRCNAGYGFWQMAFKCKDHLGANFAKVYAQMESQVADGGRVLGIRPTLLVVPPELREEALQLVKPPISDASYMTPNAWYNSVEVLVTPYIKETGGMFAHLSTMELNTADYDDAKAKAKAKGKGA